MSKTIVTSTTIKKDGTKIYPKIKCPYCGAEFLPSEIYLRDYFLGKPVGTIERDEKNRLILDDNGKPIHYQGIHQDMNEEFNCDFCDKKFVVEAEIKYTIRGVEFEEEYETPIYKDRITLGN